MRKTCMVILLSLILAVLTRSSRSLPLTEMSGIYEPPCCDGSGYEPPGTVLWEVSLNRPSAGESVPDPTFDTTITALPEGARNTYSQLQVWSYDNRYMITVTPWEGYHVRDAETFAVLHAINHSSPRWIPGTHKVVTVENEPGRIFSYDVDTGAEEVLMELSQYQYITGSQSFEELSRDGQWMSLYIANDGSGNTRLLTINLTERRIAMNRHLQDMCAPDPEWGLLEPDWIGVSPRGKYAVIQWQRAGDSLCSGLEVYDIETGQFVRRIHTHHAHSDLGLAADGREMLASFELAHPDNNNYPAIVLYWLDGSPKEYIRMVPWFRSDHISCQGPPGTWLVTAGNDEGDPLLKGELYIVQQDGSLRRIVHHRSDSCDYWAQPKATMSPDGTRVAFSSDWRGNCSQAGGFVIHNLNFVNPTMPHIHIDHTRLNFGSTAADTTSNQAFLISNNGGGTLNWTLSHDASWLDYSPASGTGPGEVAVSVNPAALTTGTYTGTITITDPDASNSPQTVTVTLKVYQPGQDSPPFGTFETPAHGAAVRGSIPVTGWVLTPPPNKIPEDGSTIDVYIDGVYVGHPVYNQYRGDIAELFPGYQNSSGALAYFEFDTTAYSSGLHTIAWTVTDNAGNMDGIGSRYFFIRNYH